MASLVLKMSVSLDVYFAPSDGSTDWIAAGDSDDGLSWTVETLSKERSDGYLLAHGGTRFARSLVETGLIDEYRLVIQPVVLARASGSSPHRSPIESISTTVFSGEP